MGLLLKDWSLNPSWSHDKGRDQWEQELCEEGDSGLSWRRQGVGSGTEVVERGARLAGTSSMNWTAGEEVETGGGVRADTSRDSSLEFIAMSCVRISSRELRTNSHSSFCQSLALQDSPLNFFDGLVEEEDDREGWGLLEWSRHLEESRLHFLADLFE